MSLSKLTPLRALARTSRVPARSGLVQRRAVQKRGYATGGPKEPADFDKPQKNNVPVMGIAIALTIPALAWFFYGRSTPPQRAGGHRGKDHSDVPAGAEVNEEPSRSVPEVQPDAKASKMANPKAVAPDEKRLDSEKDEKANTLTGTSTGGKSPK